MTWYGSLSCLHFRQCPLCPSRVANLKQHMKKTHQQKLCETKARLAPARSDFQEFRDYLINERDYAPKTAITYAVILSKLAATHADGRAGILHAPNWSQWWEEDGFFHVLKKNNSATSLSCHLHALLAYLEFLKTDVTRSDQINTIISLEATARGYE